MSVSHADRRIYGYLPVPEGGTVDATIRGIHIDVV